MNDCRNFRNGPLLLGECIPAETGAAPVHRSRWIVFARITFFCSVLSGPVVRLDCGPQWKDFLNFAEYSNPEGVSLQATFTIHPEWIQRIQLTWCRKC